MLMLVIVIVIGMTSLAPTTSSQNITTRHFFAVRKFPSIGLIILENVPLLLIVPSSHHHHFNFFYFHPVYSLLLLLR